MKQALKIIAVVSAFALIVGCDEDVDIASVFVQGTSRNENGVVPINAGVRNGAFLVSWRVTVTSGEIFDTNDTSYTIRLYVSEDDELSSGSGTDIRFYSENCGTARSADDCNDEEEGSVRCNFTNDNKIGCGAGTSEGQQETNIAEWLDELPKRAFLFLEACKGASETCDIRSARVVFR